MDEVYERVQAPRDAVDAAADIVDDRYPGKRAWFVGSRVDGNPRPDSDLDVVVEAFTGSMKLLDDEPSMGAYFRDAAAGVDVDVTEDEDGPVRSGPGSQVRFR